MSDDQDGCECVSFFWYRPTRVVPDQRPLNGCVCVCVCVFVCVKGNSGISRYKDTSLWHVVQNCPD